MPTSGRSNNRNSTLLPRFCTRPHLLRVLLVCESVAVILTLAVGHDTGHFMRRLLLLSAYVQWIGVFSAAALCLITRYGGDRLSARSVFAMCYSALLAITFLSAEMTFAAGRHTRLAALLVGVGHIEFVMRNVGICAIVSAFALGYFRLRASWIAGVEAEAAVRLQALHARIRPHFLFNSLNSIAALIAQRPAEAERSTEDLALLLRAHLRSDTPVMVRLAEELALVEAYLRIEKQRLGQRLVLDWDVAVQTLAYLVPPLCLQPLVENAIIHGICSRPGGGILAISTQMNGRQLWIRITNPLADADMSAPGNQQALRNIQQRLALHYGQQARLLTMEKAGCFYVDFIVPARLTWHQD